MVTLVVFSDKECSTAEYISEIQVIKDVFMAVKSDRRRLRRLKEQYATLERCVADIDDGSVEETETLQQDMTEVMRFELSSAEARHNLLRKFVSALL